jgi:hypothetical protein
VVRTVITVQSHLPGNSPPSKLGRKPCCASSLRPSASVAMNYVEGEGCINSFPFHHSIQRRRRNPNPFYLYKAIFFYLAPSTFLSVSLFLGIQYVLQRGGGYSFLKILTPQFSIVSPLAIPSPGRKGVKREGQQWWLVIRLLHDKLLWGK